MTPAHRQLGQLAGPAYEALLNQTRPAGRYRLLDRNTDPGCFPAHDAPVRPVNPRPVAHLNPYLEEGS